ncbi:MAG: bifunctional diaminohydroxyphosphoribosylaminopyrimidine deaminase/5-amino-6-(5-phosphoribosylamino)uracil reductase RibD [Rhodospirillaceae bacterium]|nr:bifunctional diaminohydroxyphosphoribosylaminopyrimidine deaminase/5-amino-6-(5-phosphoribosylamino)uracil reductase RibD [Rhodospirillaceae bacterium]MCY4311198.1 bifunctional diaminohydroxyphosphoribosylaminopyrimidine deaminase/5-amino-6-(5-phosphoribosylamino)uracil reductase RibD [Rhodospirillaceae bacterium]
MTAEIADARWMAVALDLGRRGLGTTAPNPSVGCVIIKEDRVVGRGWTQPGGRPHAETEALARAGDAARGATAYVTLEPCAHHGRTPPCAASLVAAGISRVVVATTDPDPRTNGAGLKMLQDAGIRTTVGLGAVEALSDLGGFLTCQQSGRPRVTLKLATSLDGRIATAGGDSQWITGLIARLRNQALRAQHDAVLVGIETALIDNPQLTCRLPGWRLPTTRIVLDSRARLPVETRLVSEANEHPLIQIVGDHIRSALSDCPGVTVSTCPTDKAGRLRMEHVLAVLAKQEVNDLLVEGGGQVAASLLRSDLVDRLCWLHAGMVLGGDARPSVASLELARISEAAKWQLHSREPCGDDLLETWHRLTDK